MLPMRTEYGQEYGTGTDTESAPVRTRLTLQDTSQDVSPAPVKRSGRSRKSVQGMERAVLALTIAGALLFLAITSVGAVWNQAVAAYAASHSQVRPTVVVHVGKGDTLWRYASQYGDPNSYILDRVQSIAADNHLPSTAALTPGQTLHITVQNPIELAKLNNAAQARIASRSVH